MIVLPRCSEATRPRRGLPGGVRVVLGAVLGLALAASACTSRDSATPHVILVTLDTMRADRLGSGGYSRGRTPNLDRLARGATVFANAFTSAPITLPAHASILTGSYPAWHGVRDNGIYVLSDPDNVTLAETLRDHGFATVAIVSSFVLNSRFGLAQGFDVYDDDPASMRQAEYRSPPERFAAETTRTALEHARAAVATGRPVFLWVHYFDPHAPFVAPDPWAEMPEAPRADPYAGYDAEIAYMDDALGDLLDSLGRLGLLDRSVVVVVGDHGEGLESPHVEQTHGVFLYDETLRVPLLVRDGTGTLSPGVALEDVSVVDVAPTILEALGIEPESAGQGRSLAGTQEASGGTAAIPRPLLSETFLPYHTFGWSPLFAIRQGDWKLVRAPRRELFDLTTDPAEAVDRFPSEWVRGRELDDRLTRELASAGRTLGPQRPALGAEEKARLEALGYLSQDSAETDLPEDGRFPDKDPKDLLPVYRNMLAASDAAKDRDWPRAISLLRGALARDPGNFRARCNLGDFLLESGDLDGALREYRTALERHPSSQEIHLRLGRAHRLIADRDASRGDASGATKEYQEAASEFRRALALSPGDPVILVQLAEIAARPGGNLDEAAELYRLVLDLEPRDREARVGLATLRLARGRAAEALPLLEDLPGNDEEIRTAFLLGEIYRALGRREEAGARYRRVLRLDPNHEGAKNGLRLLGE